MSEQICVVTSIPDDKRGERLVVLSLPAVDLTALSESLKKSGLPNLWIPDKEMFFHVESFGLLGTGKLDLAGIKHRAIQLTSISGDEK